MKTHDCDFLIDYFNSQLTEEQEKAFENHLKECSTCQEEWDEWQAMTEALPYSSEPVDPPEGMKNRILSNVLQHSDHVDERDKSNEKVTSLSEKPHKTKQERYAWLRPVMAALLLISLVGNGLAAVYIASVGSNNTTSGPEQVQPIASENVYAMKALKPSKGIHAQATAIMIKNNQSINLILQAQSMPQVQGKETYQIWVIDNGNPYRAGHFVPQKDGQASLSHVIDYSGKHNWDTIAITKEPNAHSQKPHGKILLSASL